MFRLISFNISTYRSQSVAWYLRCADRMRNPTYKKDRKSSHAFLYSGSLPPTSHNFTAHPFSKYQATFCDLYRVSHHLCQAGKWHKSLVPNKIDIRCNMFFNTVAYVPVGIHVPIYLHHLLRSIPTYSTPHYSRTSTKLTIFLRLHSAFRSPILLYTRSLKS
jgi:hypothetical protein